MVKFIQASVKRTKTLRSKSFKGCRFYFAGAKMPSTLSFLTRRIAQESKLRAMKLSKNRTSVII